MHSLAKVSIIIRHVVFFTCAITLGTHATEADESLNFENRCHEEVVALHVVIEHWLAGRLPNSDEAYAPFSAAMAKDFEIISPSGVLSDRARILASLRGAHGAQAESFRITIKNIRTRYVTDGEALLTYEEWQTAGDQSTARLSSVWLREDRNAPRGVAWVHLHETWLPGLGPGSL